MTARSLLEIAQQKQESIQNCCVQPSLGVALPKDVAIYPMAVKKAPSSKLPKELFVWLSRIPTSALFSTPGTALRHTLSSSVWQLHSSEPCKACWLLRLPRGRASTLRFNPGAASNQKRLAASSLATTLRPQVTQKTLDSYRRQVQDFQAWEGLRRLNWWLFAPCSKVLASLLLPPLDGAAPCRRKPRGSGAALILKSRRR